jgi:hypothetical protein
MTFTDFVAASLKLSRERILRSDIPRVQLDCPVKM